MCKWKLWRKSERYIYHPQKFADLKASSVLSNTETILSVVSFSGFGDGLFLAYRLSLKVAISWLVSELIATGKESIIPYLDRAEQCKTSLGGKA